MKYTPRDVITKVKPHVRACATNLKTGKYEIVSYVLRGGDFSKRRATNLRDIRVPINVANVVISQAGKQTDQMLQRSRTTCHKVSTAQ